MGFLSVVKGIIFRNEIAADVSADNGFEKLVEWWGLDSKKPRAIAETTYFTCLRRWEKCRLNSIRKMRAADG